MENLFPAPRKFGVRIGDDLILDAAAEREFTLRMPSASVLRNVFRPPVETSLGNAFLRGDLDVEGDVCRVFPVVEACRTAARSPATLMNLVRLWRALPQPESPAAPARGEPREAPPLRGAPHSENRDRAAIVYHYDLGNDFFQLFLDPRMIYSCAYFRSRDENLAAAQEYKLDQVCRKLRLQPGDRLLDVGCGWGGLLIYAAENSGISGVGITLSERQCELARERVALAGLGNRIEIRLQDYRSLGGEIFDKVSSIGMFEHVGRARLPGYFSAIRDVMRPGGLFLNHGISRQATAPAKTIASKLRDPLNHLIVGTSPMTRYVFPDSELIALSEVNLHAEQAGLEVRDVENMREHYDLTLRHWIDRLEGNRQAAIDLVGPATYRLWRLYFAASAYRFEIGRISVNQTLLARLDGGRTDVPLSRSVLYS
jgi:cyclopropane-fatty-acyl-phospholipid synthase